MVAQKDFYHNDEFATCIESSGNGIYITKKIDSIKQNNIWVSGNELTELITNSNLRFNYRLLNKYLSFAHAPLYFWVAHTWGSTFGFNKYVFIALNFLIELLLLASLLVLLNQLHIRNRSIQFIIAIVIILHPFGSESFILFRHYGLLSLFTITSAGLIFKIFQQQKLDKRPFLWLFFAIFLGSLCHFIFPFLIASLCLASFVTSKNFKLFIAVTIISITAYALAFASQYDIFFKVISGEKAYNNWAGINFISYLFGLPLRLFIPRTLILYSKWWLLVIACMAMLIFTIKLARTHAQKYAFYSAICLIATFAILAILNKIPDHSIFENRYLLAFSPFYLCGIYLSISKFSKTWLNIFLFSMLIYGSTLSMYQSRSALTQLTKAPKTFILKGGSMDLGVLAQNLAKNQLIKFTDIDQLKSQINKLDSTFSIIIRQNNFEAKDILEDFGNSEKEKFSKWVIYTFTNK